MVSNPLHCTSDIGENSVFFHVLWSETDVQTCDIGDMLYCQHVVPSLTLGQVIH